MRILQGASQQTDAAAAVAEATRSFPTEPGAAAPGPDLVLAFSSTKQDPHELTAALAKRFPGTRVVGCTTAGEILDASHSKGGLVLSAITSPSIRWAVRTAPLADFDADTARRVTDELFADVGLGRGTSDVDPAHCFCLAFIDGLSMQEEQVVSWMADALEGLPLLGGSAGDDLAFQRTYVFAHGEALTGAALFLLARSEQPFEIVKHQHYSATGRSLVITRADVATRRVYEMDGYPAVEAYARALGLTPDQVDSDVCFMNPLTFVYGGEIYVRSIQRVEADQSLVFYCGIEEGMVLRLGGHEEMVNALDRDLDDHATSTEPRAPADLFIACNCILRALETEKRGLEREVGQALSKRARHVIGFDTYGEQLDGLHINQTLVGVALRGEDRA
jgi:hypothetical protein